MNESEALKLLKKANRDNDMVGILPKSGIGKCLIKALEKQIPKEPVRDEYCGFVSYECPTCHHDVTNVQRYCDKCGQKLGE